MQSKKILTAVLGAALVAGAPMAAAQTGDPELPGISPLPLSVATCNGLAGTIVGLTGDDTLDGTPGPDVIVGNGGDDTIRGKGGNAPSAGATASITSPEAPMTTLRSAKTVPTSR